ncbi:hypothetical protein N8I77_007666 [Diaporthe amygdali]|uniref:AAA+ ATPase domain-containing protein n=1 Tax=Phomopsis amygdali TaxID=1214568 RepID=A0AAD9W4B5_PHOAM|nr:hypothetical protein N8I77_007666 [Diaporthe amygdali]
MAENGKASGTHTANETMSPQESDISSHEENPALGMTPSVFPMYSGEEDRRGRFQWQTQVPQNVARPVENTESEKWAIIARRSRVYGNSERTYAIDSIIVQSPLLKVLLEDVLDGYSGVTVALKRLVFVGRCEPLMHRWAAWRETIESMQKKRQDGEGNAHLDEIILHAKLLDDLLQEEFGEISQAITDYKHNGVITFQHLWTIFEPNILVFAPYLGQNRALLLRESNYDRDNDKPIFELICSYVDFDGERVVAQRTRLIIPDFSGTMAIKNLAAFPLKMHGQFKQMRTSLVQRGCKFELLAGTHYRNYSGPAWTRIMSKTRKQYNVKGRVVIDAFAFKQCNPVRNLVGGNDEVSDIGHGTATDSDVPAGGPLERDDNLNRPKLDDGLKLICSPFIRGYALKEKKWFCLCVDAVSEIAFNELAFSDLRLAGQRKDLILGFLSSKQSYQNTFDDLIEGKGLGVIILLSGPPGVGKTLTAESVAEQMRVPLYNLAAGDLGFDARSVEKVLSYAMWMCTRWNAVLLLDEADVLLEQRSFHELERNKLVSIFLRRLEYYEGIMFLTTNRVSTFDTAFQSRIHISLEYPELDRKCRKGIWEVFLRRHDEAQEKAREKPVPVIASTPKASMKRVLSPPTSANSDAGASAENHGPENQHRKLTQPHRISDKEVDKLADLKLNGREIKNFLKTAQLLAVYREEALDYGHIQTAVSVTHHFHTANVANEEALARVYN